MSLPCEQCRQPAATRFQNGGDARWRCARCAGIGVWSQEDQVAALREQLEQATARAEAAEYELRELRSTLKEGA